MTDQPTNLKEWINWMVGLGFRWVGSYDLNVSDDRAIGTCEYVTFLSGAGVQLHRSTRASLLRFMVANGLSWRMSWGGFSLELDAHPLIYRIEFKR